MALNIVQQERQVQQLSDDMLRQMLFQMTQTGQVGTPQQILVAGEIQARKDARQKAMAGQGNKTPVIFDLLTDGAMPPQMPPQMPTQTAMLPENAGGIAGLPAPNMDNMEPYTAAAGGLVAFSNGGVTDIVEKETREIEQGLRSDYSREAKARMAEITRQRSQTNAEFLKRQQEQMLSQGRGLVPQMASPGVAPPAAPPPTPPSVTGMPVGTADVRAQMRQADNAGLAALGQAQQMDAAPTVREKTDGTTPAAPAAPAAIGMPGTDYSKIFSQAMGFAKEALPDEPTSTEPEKKPKQLIEERNQLYKDLGIEDPTKLRREQLEKEIKGAKTEKEQAGWLRLAEFGFNWASQNGPTLQAAAKAGAAVTPGLMSDLKDLRKLDRERQKELTGLAALDAQAQRATADSVLAEIEKRREQRENRLQRLEDRRATVAASIAGNVISAENQKGIASLQSATTLQAAQLTRDTTLAKLAEQLAETETKNVIDAATTMVTKRFDYANLDDDQKKDALLAAVRAVKEARRVAGTTVTPR
jgi:hypothetical protein